MVVRRFEEFDAWKLCDAFADQVLALLDNSPSARREMKFKSQLVESARGPTKHIAEGFLRKSPAAFIVFLDIAIASLGEAGDHLRDGIKQRFWSAAACGEAFALRNRAIAACLGLKRSQQRYLREREEEKDGAKLERRRKHR